MEVSVARGHRVQIFTREIDIVKIGCGDFTLLLDNHEIVINLDGFHARFTRQFYL